MAMINASEDETKRRYGKNNNRCTIVKLYKIPSRSVREIIQVLLDATPQQGYRL